MTIKQLFIFMTLLISMLCITTSCNKNPNPFVEYEQDITMVYGIINPVDTIHYIRIQKAFLTEDDAFVMASDAESNLYLDSLTVRVYVTDQYGTTIPNMDWILNKTFIDKDSVGDFTWSEKLPVYYFEKIFNHEQIQDKIFKLEITNIGSGKKIYGSTYIVNDFEVIQPSSIYSHVPQFAMSQSTHGFITFYQALYGQRYDVYAYFIYDEYPLDGSPMTTHSLKWNFGTYIFDGDAYHSGSTELAINYNPASFYTWLESKIEYNPNVAARVPRFFNFYFWSCTPDMNTYIEVNSENTGIVQDRPEYTNLTSSTGKEDVYGLFSCRYSKIYNNVQVAPTMSIYLQNNLNLNFRTAPPN